MDLTNEEVRDISDVFQERTFSVLNKNGFRIIVSEVNSHQLQVLASIAKTKQVIINGLGNRVHITIKK